MIEGIAVNDGQYRGHLAMFHGDRKRHNAQASQGTTNISQVCLKLAQCAFEPKLPPTRSAHVKLGAFVQNQLLGALTQSR
jgi:hypothetical protein